MSEDELLGKVEALIRKHRGTDPDNNEPLTDSDRPTPAVDAWLPILTDIVQRGTPPTSASNPGSDSVNPVNSASMADSAATGTAPEPTEPEKEAGKTVPENLLEELTPQISGLMREQVAEELRKSLDQSMSSLMANLNANVEEIVRKAVAQKLSEQDKKTE